MYETFDHTADLGLRVRAADLPTLFAEAGLALTSALVEDPATIQQTQTRTIKLPKDDLDYLLFDWLKTLLYHYEVDGLFFSRFDVSITDEELVATAHGETRDETRHDLSHEVKAITYHGLKVEKGGDEWLAEVIVDI